MLVTYRSVPVSHVFEPDAASGENTRHKQYYNTFEWFDYLQADIMLKSKLFNY